MDVSPETLTYIIGVTSALLGAVIKVFSAPSNRGKTLDQLSGAFQKAAVLALVSNIGLIQATAYVIPDFTYMTLVIVFEAFMFNALGFAYGLPKGALGLKGGLLMLYNALREKSIEQGAETKPEEKKAAT